MVHHNTEMVKTIIQSHLEMNSIRSKCNTLPCLVTPSCYGLHGPSNSLVPKKTKYYEYTDREMSSALSTYITKKSNNEVI